MKTFHRIAQLSTQSLLEQLSRTSWRVMLPASFSRFTCRCTLLLLTLHTEASPQVNRSATGRTIS